MRSDGRSAQRPLRRFVRRGSEVGAAVGGYERAAVDTGQRAMLLDGSRCWRGAGILRWSTAGGGASATGGRRYERSMFLWGARGCRRSTSATGGRRYVGRGRPALHLGAGAFVAVNPRILGSLYRWIVGSLYPWIVEPSNPQFPGRSIRDPKSEIRRPTPFAASIISRTKGDTNDAAAPHCRPPPKESHNQDAQRQGARTCARCAPSPHGGSGRFPQNPSGRARRATPPKQPRSP